jgi:hypothetical protein
MNLTRPLLSRREFLKLGASGLAGLFLSGLPLDFAQAGGPSSDWLGRITKGAVKVFDIPSPSGILVNTYKRDDLLPITGSVTGGEESDRNRLWYRVGSEGFAASAFIQLVRTILNEPAPDPLLKGALGEVTVPFVESRARPSLTSMTVYRMYYETTYWIARKVKGDGGSAWYRIYDDLHKVEYFVPAEYLRIVPPEEFAPLSPQVDSDLKRIEVHLDRQEFLAYEGQTLVRTARVSSGKRVYGRYTTPLGRFMTFHKRHTRHMAAGNLAAGGYDLPGVPWISYITRGGVSFHGTFWHNDFGTPHSHGCINLSVEDAKWLYRWTIPSVPPEEQYRYETFGTRLEIVE